MESQNPNNFFGWKLPSRDPHAPTPGYQPPPTHAPDAPPVPEAQRVAILDKAVQQWVTQGWRIESRMPQQAVLLRGRRPNHVLHAILTLFTCVWAIVWVIVAARGGEQRAVLTVDDWGGIAVYEAPNR